MREKNRYVMTVFWFVCMNCTNSDLGRDGSVDGWFELESLSHDLEMSNENKLHQEILSIENQDEAIEVEDKIRLELYKVIWANATFVAVGTAVRLGDSSGAKTSLQVISSDDGKWIQHNLPEPGLFRSICYGKDLFVAVGSYLAQKGDGTWEKVSYLFSSPNGQSWTRHSLPIERPTDIAFGENSFVVVGSSLEKNPVAVSTDLVAFQPVDIAAYWWTPKLLFDGQRFILYGDSGVIGESVDGMSWDFYQLQGINHVFLIQRVGQKLIGSAAFDCCMGERPELIDYYRLELPMEASMMDLSIQSVEEKFAIISVASNEKIWVGAGFDWLYSMSFNIDNWEWEPIFQVEQGATSIVFGDDLFVAGTYNGLLISDNGESFWAPATTQATDALYKRIP